MKSLNFLLSLFIITLFISFTGCSVEEEIVHREQSIKRERITFDQFKSETGLKNIQIIKSINPNSNNQALNRSIESEFIVNTDVIERCVSQDNQITYSFKVYPITADLGESEYYNLVYEKIGTQWNEILFLNKERENPQMGESKLKESTMIYNKLGPTTVSYSTITIVIHCNGSCAENGYPTCDGFACSTGECLQVSVSYSYVPAGLSDGSSSGGISYGGNNGGGGGVEGVYIPIPYEGDADLNNQDFVLAINTAAFTRSLPQNLKDVVKNNYFVHPLIVDFMRTNHGLTQANKDAVIFALTAFAPIPNNVNLTSWSFTTIEQFFINSFKYLLNNPNPEGQAFVQSLPTPREFIPEYLNQNAWSEESTIFANHIIIKMNQNPTLFTSIKPFLIEKNIDDSQLDPCSKGVFQQVKTTTNCDFANVLAKLNANNTDYNTTMITAHNNDNNGNQVDSPANTIKNSPYNYTIYVNPNYAGKTKLFIASLMFHEIIHAYFLSIVDDYKANPNNNQNLYNLNSFASIFQAYCDKKYPPASGTAANIHHLEMANHYVDAIARALQEFQTGIPVVTGASPQQIYNDLAWGGLNGTPVFDATYPIGNPNRQRILNRVACEQNGTPIGQGTLFQQNPIGQPCN